MDKFKTPKMVKQRSVSQDDKPLIPDSPLMVKLGCGTGVSVYRLKRSPKVGLYQSPWAVKRVRRTTQETSIGLDDYALRLKDEAEILKKLNHPNIIGFRAFVKTDDGRDCLAMEECDTSVGDLIELRSDDGLGPFLAENILKVALDVAKALDYLHEECHLLHGDIKSFNILVKGDFEIIKLCDFGVVVPLKANGEIDTEAGAEYVGTLPWSAPEVLCSDGQSPITNKADIFSFGLVLWEMIALSPPHLDDSLMEESSIDTATDDAVEMSIVDAAYGTRPPLPASPLGKEYRPVIELFNSCTEEDFRKRPDAREIVGQLEDLKKSQ